MENVEQFLIDNGFELDTYNQSNKYYYKVITETQILYVRIYSDANKIVDVVYKHNAVSKYDTSAEISFETIDTLKQLKSLLLALN